MRIYTLSDQLLKSCVIDPRPTLEAEARQDQGWERALMWRHVGSLWELHSINLEQAPRKVAS